MSTVKKIDKLAEWLEQEVCPEFNYKIPPAKRGGRTDYSAEIIRGHPKAYRRYLPEKDHTTTKGNGSNYQAPSIVVLPGEVERDRKTTTLPIRLLFTIWEPGIRDPKADYEKDPGLWVPDFTGWRDVVNLMDHTARGLFAAKSIDGAIIRGEEDSKIRYGTIEDEEVIPDLRDFYYGYMLFTLEYATPIDFGNMQRKTNMEI